MSERIQEWFSNFSNMKYNKAFIPDYDEIAYLWKQIKGHKMTPSLMCLTGIMFYNGFGICKDYKNAYNYFETAAFYDHPYATYCLAIMTFNGMYIMRDIRSAIKLYKRAANLKCVEAMNDLASLYVSGKDIELNIPKAIKLYTIAAQNGCNAAIMNITKLHDLKLCTDEQLRIAVEYDNIQKKEPSFISRIFHRRGHHEDTKSLLK